MSRVEEQIRHLDFVPQLACDRRTARSAPKCGKPAVWSAACARCGMAALVCDGCRDFLVMVNGLTVHSCGLAGSVTSVLKFARVA